METRSHSARHVQPERFIGGRNQLHKQQEAGSPRTKCHVVLSWKSSRLRQRHHDSRGCERTARPGRTAHSLTGVSTMNAIVSHRVRTWLVRSSVPEAGAWRIRRRIDCMPSLPEDMIAGLATCREHRLARHRQTRSSRPSTEPIDHPAVGGLCGVLLIGSSGFAGGSCQYLERHSLPAVQEISVKAGDGARNS